MFKDRVAIVTGASRGIGKGVAQSLAERGAAIVAVSRKAEDTAAMVEQINASGGRAISVAADVSDPADVEAMVAAATETFARIDILVNNAGGTRRGPADTITAEDWNYVINLNMTATFKLCQTLYVDGGLLCTFGPSSWYTD